MTRAAPRAERRKAARRDREGHSSRRRVSTGQIVAAGVVALLAVAALVWSNSQNTTAPSTTLPPGIAQAGQVRGNATAPVTIEEWADFQCPACARFARSTEPQIVTSYIATGKVRYVFHNMAFLGQESNWAAEAASCAAEQGKFWEYHDKLFASQAGENRGAFSKENLKRFGNDLGLGPSFATCFDSGKYAQSVRSETNQGQTAGVDQTPTLFVNGRKYTGALSYQQLRDIIEPLLVGR